MRISTALLFSISLIPCISFAEPVYLECRLSKDETRPPLEVRLDEENGSVTHNFGSGSFNAKGFFSAEEVSYQKHASASRHVTTVTVYSIDRINLDYLMTMTAESTNQPSKELARMEGKCKVKEVPERAF